MLLRGEWLLHHTGCMAQVGMRVHARGADDLSIPDFSLARAVIQQQITAREPAWIWDPSGFALKLGSDPAANYCSRTRVDLGPIWICS
jgi:hypothetical protein